jgi:hypothetical protein
VITLVPGGQTTVHLASWREDDDVVVPAIADQRAASDFFLADATAVRFTVVAFDDQAQFAKSVITIQKPDGSTQAGALAARSGRA